MQSLSRIRDKLPTAAVALSGLALGLVTCRSAERREQALQIIIDSTGRYPVVKSLGSAPVWRAESVFVLGSSNGGPTEFGSIRSVLLSRQGLLYVVDPAH